MILIDETKLTNGTLMSVLDEQGYNVNYYRNYTEEEIQTILKDTIEEEKERVKNYLQKVRLIDFETMFENELDKIRLYEDDLWQLVDEVEKLAKEGKEEDDLANGVVEMIEKIMRYDNINCES